MCVCVCGVGFRPQGSKAGRGKEMGSEGVSGQQRTLNAASWSGLPTGLSACELISTDEVLAIYTHPHTYISIQTSARYILGGVHVRVYAF